MNTFRESGRLFSEGANIVIFPEENKPFNAIVYDFQEGFPNVARLCAKMSGRPVPFVPFYLAPRLRRMVIGEPIWYDESAPWKGERERLRTSLRSAVTDLARSLPEHTVVPYRNITKKDYPQSTDLNWPKGKPETAHSAGAECPAAADTDKESPTT